MTIKESLHFIYDNITSEDMDIINVNVEQTGMLEDQVIATRRIKETEIRNGKRYFHEIEHEPLQIPVSFAFIDNYDLDKVRDIVRWLTPNHYKPLVFSSDYNKIYYALPVEDGRLIHDALRGGYIDLTFRCNTYHAYSPVYKSKEYEISGSKDIKIKNVGDMPVFVEIMIEKNGSGNITIENSKDEDRIFEIKNLSDEEKVYFNGDRKYIESDIPQTYRYNDFNNNYLRIFPGINNLTIEGDCKIKFKWQCKLF